MASSRSQYFHSLICPQFDHHCYIIGLQVLVFLKIYISVQSPALLYVHNWIFSFFFTQVSSPSQIMNPAIITSFIAYNISLRVHIIQTKWSTSPLSCSCPRLFFLFIHLLQHLIPFKTVVKFIVIHLCLLYEV